MSKFWFAFAAAAWAAGMVVAQSATCVTPEFTCPAEVAGPPGQVCYCPSGSGYVQGTLG